MKRRAVFWIVVALSAAVILAVTGAILYSFFNEEAVKSSEASLAYVTVFALVFCEAIVPIFPGETTLNTASVLPGAALSSWGPRGSMFYGPLVSGSPYHLLLG